ncbi:MAG TPA: hypothetical protein VFZ65_16495 [Planctomycetota bacterium]|nr:hypothetical protein [Planctomycetota bacterium]
MFQSPQAIDVHRTVDVATPASWRAALPDQEHVPVLRLCDGKGPPMPGWCAVGSDLQGPEFEVVCGGINSKQPGYAAIWRQGNLLHFGFEPRPSEYNETGRRLLLNAIAYIARFATDRPIVRARSFVDPQGGGASIYWLDFMLHSPKADAAYLGGLFAVPWRERLASLDLADARAFVQERLGALCVDGGRFAFDDDALQLGVDVRKPGVLGQLAELLRGDSADRARALLLRLVPDGPGADTTPNNWRNWLHGREPAMCFDVHSCVWRLDPLAYWRGEKSADLSGPSRADGDAQRDPVAAELAAKIVAFHGGARAFDDLQCFTCRFGDERCLWDRRRGIFRVENGGEIPAGNLATPWQVAIFDTAADADLLRGGGPEPRPFVSGRGSFRELQERLFLPLLLLDPGTTLRRLPDDAEGHRQLEVHLAGRCTDLLEVHVLHVDASSGALLAIDETPRAGGRTTPWTIDGTMRVGPLLLPRKFVRNTNKSYEIEYQDAQWNPPVPEGADSKPEKLLGGA